MKISGMWIRNFKSVKELHVEDIDSVMILVGKNNTGKTVVLDAILAAAGKYEVRDADFLDAGKNIEIGITLDISEDDLHLLQQSGVVSRLRRYDAWKKEFMTRLPSFVDGKISFTYIVEPNKQSRYFDGIKKNNLYIPQIFPKVHFIDHTREVGEIEEDIFWLQSKEQLKDMREERCMFDSSKSCGHCFQCVGMIHQKKPEELTIYESAKLLEYKLFQLNIGNFTDKLNECFHKNSGRSQDIKYVMNFDVDSLFKIDTMVVNKDRKTEGNIDHLSAGSKSIYILSLLETYAANADVLPSIIMIEDPEIYLHPQLQKIASEILFRLSKKNQVIFSTHSPNMLFNFSSRQIKQVILDEEYYTVVKEDTDIDEILDDLGYTANDLMNVSFVFIVEGKQDSNRLPLLLEKYYSEIYDEEGRLQRISIIPTNSCTNIKTYANLKYINKLYLKDQFLMIRDSDGKNPNYLVKQLCNYYGARAREEDAGNVPRVQPQNVLVLKYYSFENYFLDPAVMAKIGVIKNEEEFYKILYEKYKAYLYKLPSMKRMIKITGARIRSIDDLKKNMENIKIYVRGHNLYDIFYGKYRSREKEILKRYIDEAPRETFANILDAIDSFVFFESRKRKDENEG